MKNLFNTRTNSFEFGKCFDNNEFKIRPSLPFLSLKTVFYEHTHTHTYEILVIEKQTLLKS